MSKVLVVIIALAISVSLIGFGRYHAHGQEPQTIGRTKH